jgi:hypothetical protein
MALVRREPAQQMGTMVRYGGAEDEDMSKPTVRRLASGALTAMAQAAIEAAGLGARRKIELVAVNQTLQAQATAVASAASERVQTSRLGSGVGQADPPNMR